MASVRMTRELRYQIQERAEAAFDTANPKPKPVREFLDYVKEAITESKSQRLIADWITQAREAGMYDHEQLERDCPREIDIHKISLATDPQSHYDIELEWPAKWKLPTFQHRRTRYDWDTVRFYIDSLDERFRAIATEHFTTLREQLEAHKTATAEYRSQIRELLNKVTTLKQLLEVWPGAESLIPPEKIQQMHTKVTRKERAQSIKEEVSFDPTIANQTVLAAKMLGG